MSDSEVHDGASSVEAHARAATAGSSQTALGVVGLANAPGKWAGPRGMPGLAPRDLLFSLGLCCFFMSANPRGTGSFRTAVSVVCAATLLYGLAQVPRLWRRRSALTRFALNLGTILQTPDETRRLWCCGRPREIASVAEFGLVSDQAFEPRVFRIWKLEGRAAALGWVLGVAISAATFGVLWTWASSNAVFLTGFALHSGLVIVAGVYKPQYLRVTPGNLEVLESASWGRTVRVRRSLALHNARVIADFTQNALFIDPVGKEPQVVHVHHEQARVFQSVLLAAASSARVPEIEPGLLTG